MNEKIHDTKESNRGITDLDREEIIELATELAKVVKGRRASIILDSLDALFRLTIDVSVFPDMEAEGDPK